MLSRSESRPSADPDSHLLRHLEALAVLAASCALNFGRSPTNFSYAASSVSGTPTRPTALRVDLVRLSGPASAPRLLRVLVVGKLLGLALVPTPLSSEMLPRWHIALDRCPSWMSADRSVGCRADRLEEVVEVVAVAPAWPLPS
jgi:hypothetical protein